MSQIEVKTYYDTEEKVLIKYATIGFNAIVFDIKPIKVLSSEELSKLWKKVRRGKK